MRQEITGNEMDQPRVVEAGHGRFSAMRFKFRARIESRVRRTWFGYGAEVTEFRYVLEKYHMSWEDVHWSSWGKESAAHHEACRKLDSIEATPKGSYVTR